MHIAITMCPMSAYIDTSRMGPADMKKYIIDQNPDLILI